MKNKMIVVPVVVILILLGIGLWMWLLLGDRSEEVSVNTTGEPVTATSTSPDAGCPKLSNDFALGAKSADLKGDLEKLQTFLTVKGHFGSTTPNGTFNQGVSDALKKWQKSVGFEATGIIDPTMRTAIASACAEG